MDKSAIPTVKIKIGEKEDQKEIELYQWLTQQEDDEYQNILTGGEKLELSSSDTDSIKFSATIANVTSARNYLVEHYCINLKPEEFNVMNPALRSELAEKIQELYAKKK